MQPTRGPRVSQDGHSLGDIFLCYDIVQSATTYECWRVRSSARHNVFVTTDCQSCGHRNAAAQHCATAIPERKLKGNLLQQHWRMCKPPFKGHQLTVGAAPPHRGVESNVAPPSRPCCITKHTIGNIQMVARARASGHCEWPPHSLTCPPSLKPHRCSCLCRQPCATSAFTTAVNSVTHCCNSADSACSSSPYHVRPSGMSALGNGSGPFNTRSAV
jgi:hypothetical protein